MEKTTQKNESEVRYTAEQAEKGRIELRDRLVAEARKFNLLSNVFMSVALKDRRACQHVLRILLGIPDLIVMDVRTQYQISKIASVNRGKHASSRVILLVFCVILRRRTSSTPPSFALKTGRIPTAEVEESEQFELACLQGT